MAGGAGLLSTQAVNAYARAVEKRAHTEVGRGSEESKGLQTRLTRLER